MDEIRVELETPLHKSETVSTEPNRITSEATIKEEPYYPSGHDTLVDEEQPYEVVDSKKLKIEPFQIVQNICDVRLIQTVASPKLQSNLDGITVKKESSIDDTDLPREPISNKFSSDIFGIEPKIFASDNIFTDEEQPPEEIDVKEEKFLPYVAIGENTADVECNQSSESASKVQSILVSYLSNKVTVEERPKTDRTVPVSTNPSHNGISGVTSVRQELPNDIALTEEDRPNEDISLKEEIIIEPFVFVEVRSTPDVESEETENFPSNVQTRLEDELGSMNDVLHCNECRREWDGDCPKHGPLIAIHDSEVSLDEENNIHAIKTCPPQITVGDTNIPEKAKGVFAQEALPCRIRFGPMQGKVVSSDKMTAFSWLIRKNGIPFRCIDVREPGTSNWMRYVNIASDDSEKNCEAYQYRGQLFFRTIREISPKEELLVGSHDHNGLLIKYDPDLCHPSAGVKQKSGSTDILYCNDCGRGWTGDCPKHGPLIAANDSEVSQDERDNVHAIKTCPPQITVGDSTIPEKAKGVFAQEALPCRIRFGPMQGKVVSCDKMTAFSWLIRKNGKLSRCIDVGDPGTSNWMRYVKIASDESEKNCEAYQYREELFFKTIREISPNEELVVGPHDRNGLLMKYDPDLCDPSAGCKRRAGDQARSAKTGKDDRGKSYECEESNAQFHSKHKLTLHRQTHPEEKQFPCTVCNRRYLRQSNLNAHMRVHSGHKPFVCSVCNQRFVNNCRLSAHKRSHTGEKPFRCTECNRCFAHGSHLNRHKRTHTGERPYVCTVCTRRFSVKSSLDTHMRSHVGNIFNPKPFACSVCNRTFSACAYLNKHKRTHTGEKPYVCTVCTRRFSEKSCLVVHMRTHSGNKPFECMVCNRRFSDRCNLTVHMRRHTGEKPYLCAVCNQRFLSSSHLNVHMRSHTGEKPFVCTVCNQRFITKTSLSKHVRNSTCSGAHLIPEVMQINL